MDQKLFFLINHEWTSPAFDLLMATLSSLDLWMPLPAVLIACLGAFGGFRMRSLVIILALVVGISDGVVSNGLKHAVNRPRPRQVEAVRVVDFQKAKPRFLALFRPLAVKSSTPETGVIEGRSFPSSHTVNLFAVAVVLSAFFRRYSWLFFVIAAGVAYSRIYTGSHWPSDVLASLFIGIGLGLLVSAGAEVLWNALGGRVAPALHRRHPSLFASGGTPA